MTSARIEYRIYLTSDDPRRNIQRETRLYPRLEEIRNELFDLLANNITIYIYTLCLCGDMHIYIYNWCQGTRILQLPGDNPTVLRLYVATASVLAYKQATYRSQLCGDVRSRRYCAD